MRFARIVYTIAGIWGIAALTPFYWLIDLTGRRYAPPAMYPQFFYGFMSLALVWQIVFLIIGSNPAKFRALMVPTVLEKLAFIVPCTVLYLQGRISGIDAQAAVPDAVLGTLFVVSILKTRS